MFSVRFAVGDGEFKIMSLTPDSIFVLSGGLLVSLSLQANAEIVPILYASSHEALVITIYEN
jgi:hypothetical protein